MSMQIVTAKPPCYEEAAKIFGLKPDDIVYFTYGDIIYNPTGGTISPDTIVHEETHGEQQEMSSEVAVFWWQRYMHDAEFRIEQESEAYGAQYEWLCRQYRDRNKRARMLHTLASALAGPLYGNAISITEAKEKISTYSMGGGMRE